MARVSTRNARRSATFVSRRDSICTAREPPEAGATRSIGAGAICTRMAIPVASLSGGRANGSGWKYRQGKRSVGLLVDHEAGYSTR